MTKFETKPGEFTTKVNYVEIWESWEGKEGGGRREEGRI
jgi:hypothetical protein